MAIEFDVRYFIVTEYSYFQIRSVPVMKIFEFSVIIPASFRGLRLDNALSNMFPEYSRTRLQKWIRNGSVTVDGKSFRTRDIVFGGELVRLRIEMTDECQLKAEAIELDVIFEDRTILVVNKPAGLVVHPGAGNPSGTLANALLYHDPELAAIPRAGIVHRLDKDTSGLLVVAKHLQSHSSLVEQLQQRIMRRNYVALVYGKVVSGGTVSEPIGRHPVDRKKMAVIASGKKAVTHFRVRKRYGLCTLLDVQLETGRTHQIRVHMAHSKYPVVGDQVYGKRLKPTERAGHELITSFPRQALHASYLEILHPDKAKKYQWSAPLPSDFRQLLDSLDQHDHADG